ncbi:MAG: BatA domain-containing protein [Bacteroidota bacterium]|nr:BatA domain-containing protein [Bacteroidota bacterium]
MIYQNPQLLYALLAIAIPILIHLFNFRKHKIIYFSSIRFLKEIKEENKKKSELKNILILLSRILAISFLVIAFAKPYTPADTTKMSNNIFLYIDNSQSMDIDFGKGNLLNSAKNKAIEISQVYPSENNFYLITNDFESKHTSSYTADVIKSQIEKTESSSKQRRITDIVSRMNSITSSNSHLYFISDFQENTIAFNGLKGHEINNKISLIPIANSNTSNISIDSLFTSGPIFTSDNEIEIHVIIRNTSNEDIKDEVLFLYLDGKQKSQQYISLLAKETKEILFKFLTTNNRFINGEIRTHDSPITFDNNLFFTLTKAEKINITTLNKENENTAFKALFGNDTALFNFTSLNLENINHNTLSKQDFIILNEVTQLSSGLLNTLLSFTNNGGSLLVVPPADLVNFNDYNILLNSLGINTIARKRESELKINQFRTKHPVYKNVFTETLDKVNYPMSNQAYFLNKKKICSQIIGFADKQDFLSAYTSKQGSIYQFSSPLNNSYNNFTKHALFVPTLINMATSSILVNTPYYIIGSDEEISSKYINTSTDITHIKGVNIDIIPTFTNKHGKQLLNTHNQITKNGIYSILTNDQLVDKVAFNYNTSESIMSSLTTNQLEDFISTNNIKNTTVMSTENTALKTIIKEQEIGKEYWKIAIILSLLFFALEILLIKLIKL